MQRETKVICAGAAETMEDQIRRLFPDVIPVKVKSLQYMVFLEVMGHSRDHCIVSAPSGKGDGKRMDMRQRQLPCFSVVLNPETGEIEAESGDYGSLRDRTVVEKDYRPLDGYPGVSVKESIGKGFQVPENVAPGFSLLTLEGQEQTPMPGDVLSIDRHGNCHVIDRKKLGTKFLVELA